MIRLNNRNDAWSIAREAGVVYNPAADVVIARVDDAGLLGGVIYQNYTRESISMHVAGFTRTWLNRDMLWAAFQYPFGQLHCARVFLQIPETNVKSLEFAQNLGFKIVTKIDGVFSDGACVVLRLDKDECRWLSIQPRGEFETAAMGT